MNFEAKDSIALAALVLSAVSLYLSARNSGFQQEVKIAELRRQILVSQLRVRVESLRLRAMLLEVAKNPETMADWVELPAALDQTANAADNVIKNGPRFEEMLRELPGKTILMIFGKHLADLEETGRQIAGMADDLSARLKNRPPE